jgi:hypothetical protein
LVVDQPVFGDEFAIVADRHLVGYADGCEHHVKDFFKMALVGSGRANPNSSSEVSNSTNFSGWSLADLWFPLFLNLKLQGSGFGCCQFATRLIASLKASVGGLCLWYVECGGLVVFACAGGLLIFLFSLSVILVLSSRRCWMLVGFPGGSLVRSVVGASGNRMCSSDGSICAWFSGVSIVSSTVKSDSRFGGGIVVGAVGILRWSLV